MKIFLPLICLCMALTAFSDGRSVDYEVDGERYEGYFVSPAEDAPLVVLIHDWEGLTDYEMKRARMLAEAGYAVFAADLFGKGIRPTEMVDRRQHTGELYTDREKMRRLMRGALAAAEAEGANTERVVAMGYCFGGAAVLEWARSGDPLKGFVSFHGGLSTPEGQSYAETKAPVLIFHGTADTAIPMEEFVTLAKELDEHDVPNELITYGGAPHAFTVFDSDRYREIPDKRSWARFLDFLSEVFETNAD
ncbi:MAG: dienelactone hydrolase family protein [Verrucomicrobia bacterium]|nr:dienelactone hydrolase family protein [Verrucomicrobiota bacterium]MCH8514377.1 dienelactone hydrolase family protein [Kiritimatiellia bacterium]